MTATNEPLEEIDRAPPITPGSPAGNAASDAASTPVAALDSSLEDAVRRSMDDFEIERTARQSTPPRAPFEILPRPRR